MSYALYDTNGYIGDFSTTKGLQQLIEAVEEKEGLMHLKDFLNAGASLITKELIADIDSFSSSDSEVQKMKINLQELLKRGSLAVFINNGLE